MERVGGAAGADLAGDTVVLWNGDGEASTGNGGGWAPFFDLKTVQFGSDIFRSCGMVGDLIVRGLEEDGVDRKVTVMRVNFFLPRPAASWFLRVV